MPYIGTYVLQAVPQDAMSVRRPLGKVNSVNYDELLPKIDIVVLSQEADPRPRQELERTETELRRLRQQAHPSRSELLTLESRMRGLQKLIGKDAEQHELYLVRSAHHACLYATGMQTTNLKLDAEGYIVNTRGTRLERLEEQMLQDGIPSIKRVGNIRLPRLRRRIPVIFKPYSL